MSFSLSFWVLLYFTALALAGIGVGRWGGAPERLGAAAMIGAAVATQFSAFVTPIGATPYAMMIVDAALLLLLLALALRSDRYWPLWATAFHLTSMTVHLAKVVDPEVAWIAYVHANAFWAYPMVLALMIGAWVEGPRGRRRVAR